MIRTAALILTLVTLTGCSELQVIGRAAMVELGQDEVINVEMAVLQQQDEAPMVQVRRTQLAKANFAAPGARIQVSQAATPQKGLWEGR